MSIQQDIKQQLESKTNEELDNLSEWWLSYKFQKNDFEDEEQYETRKAIAVPLIIEEKLRRSEEI